MTLRLRQCGNCEHFVYPAEDFCPRCLSGNIREVASTGTGRVLSYSVQHTSLDPSFAERLPLTVLLVHLDAGPVVYALAERDRFQSGDQVQLRVDENQALAAVP